MSREIKVERLVRSGALSRLGRRQRWIDRGDVLLSALIGLGGGIVLCLWLIWRIVRGAP
jgi:hypothetical protein